MYGCRHLYNHPLILEDCDYTCACAGPGSYRQNVITRSPEPDHLRIRGTLLFQTPDTALPVLDEGSLRRQATLLVRAHWVSHYLPRCDAVGLESTVACFLRF